jgi:hypothetical protein
MEAAMVQRGIVVVVVVVVVIIVDLGKTCH